MYKFLLPLFFLFATSAKANFQFFGTYEQATPAFIGESKNELVVNKFQTTKVTYIIDKEFVAMLMGGKVAMKLPYELHDRTIVATDDGEFYVVLYIKDSQSIYGTAQKFNKIK